jgi:hypothetical protein
MLDLATQRCQDYRSKQTVLFAPDTATSYLRNTRLPDGSPAVKEDIERYILGHAGKGAHAGYGKQWFETLKAAVEVIPNLLEGSVSDRPIR